jgi:non-heme chloroperoxidase
MRVSRSGLRSVRANAAYKKQKRNKGVTEIATMPDRGHTLTIDAGWLEVAEKVLEFIKRFTSRPADRS